MSKSFQGYKNMEDKNIEKLNRLFKISKWLFIISAICAGILSINTVITQEVTVFEHVLALIQSVACSLMLAFIFGRMSVSKKE